MLPLFQSTSSILKSSLIIVVFVVFWKQVTKRWRCLMICLETTSCNRLTICDISYPPFFCLCYIPSISNVTSFCVWFNAHDSSYRMDHFQFFQQDLVQVMILWIPTWLYNKVNRIRFGSIKDLRVVIIFLSVSTL